MKHRIISSDIQRTIQLIKVHTRRLLSGALSGSSRSALRGSGFELDQIREYQVGDDIRFIDWNASARMNNLLVKEYIEERSRVIMLCVDVSGSTSFGSGLKSKRDIIAEIASILALVANFQKDRVGLMLFSDQVELYIPPSHGMQHVQILMEHLHTHKPSNTKTSISSAIEWLARLKRRDTIAFLISDFIDHNTQFERYLAAANRVGNLVALRCLDAREIVMPAVGFLPVEDAENGAAALLDLRSSGSARLSHFLSERCFNQARVFKKRKIDLLDIALDRDYISDLIRFFRRRMHY